MQGGEGGDANALFGVVGGGHGVIAWIGRRLSSLLSSCLRGEYTTQHYDTGRRYDRYPSSSSLLSSCLRGEYTTQHYDTYSTPRYIRFIQ